MDNDEGTSNLNHLANVNDSEIDFEIELLVT